MANTVKWTKQRVRDFLAEHGEERARIALEGVQGCLKMNCERPTVKTRDLELFAHEMESLLKETK